MASFKRSERVSVLIQEEVNKIIHEDLKDPRIGFVTVTKVDMTPDLRYTKIFVSIYGDKEAVKKSMEALKKATPFVRREIGSRVKLRLTPEICFKYDET
ncbi:MAG: 30S ribosome-binding factor RbfA, partial [bacterium]